MDYSTAFIETIHRFIYLYHSSFLCKRAVGLMTARYRHFIKRPFVDSFSKYPLSQTCCWFKFNQTVIWPTVADEMSR